MKWRVFGYTAHQLADPEAKDIGGYDRESPLRAIEMAAHLIENCDLLVIQKVRH